MKKFNEMVVGDTLNVYTKDTEDFVSLLKKEKVIDIMSSDNDDIGIIVTGDIGFIVDGDESIKMFSGENSDNDVIVSTEDLSRVPWVNEK